jgi:prevent-host-death family protein
MTKPISKQKPKSKKRGNRQIKPNRGKISFAERNGRYKMVVNVSYDEVKTKIADLIEAALRGDKVVISKNGRQIIQLVPMKTARRRKFGSAKGKIKFNKGYDEPLADFREYMP